MTQGVIDCPSKGLSDALDEGGAVWNHCKKASLGALDGLKCETRHKMVALQDEKGDDVEAKE